ncbi:hypothetical protein MIMGU_mgv1a022409mg [Erythranthe guttata]|uniref:PGG domain-containing protein n=1 Tax=Erythranthe guttata TaxID=4155 RepID=A0A022PT86_ERYGU|nr:hypothetical protein MIMGU_mgv1a022409mg [Erythranthe guttata]
MKGSISSLQKMLNQDPLVLDRFSVNSFSDTPLHVAAMLGHTDFVKEIVSIKPELVNELNSHKSSPLHLASSKGHVGVVKAILSSVDSRTICLARDRNGLNPLHLAALKGRIEVLQILLQAEPEAAQMTVYRDENILHLCVKHYQLEPLKLMVETALAHPNFINSKDGDGNTLLHLAVADKQVETINFLLNVPAFEVNAVNLNGLTAVDVLIQSRRDVRDMEIEDLQPDLASSSTPELQKDNSWNGMMKQQLEWLEKHKSALMVVASLTASMAFQVGVNPPGGVWQDDKLRDDQGNPLPNPQYAGFSIYATKHPRGYTRFCIITTFSFVSSLSIILLLVSGLPIRRRFYMWILIVITWVAITTIAFAYVVSIVALTPNKNRTLDNVIGITIVVWIGLMTLLVMAHTIHFTKKIVRKMSSGGSSAFLVPKMSAGSSAILVE